MSRWSRLANVFRAGRVERELEAEQRFHLDERIRELMAAGLTREAAAAQAARRFGNPLRWREQSRDVKRLPSGQSIARDVVLAIRTLQKTRTITGAAIVSLSLALGACVAAFSLVDALILRPLPVRQPEQLVYLAFPTYSAERPEADTFNDPVFVTLRDAGRSHVDLFAMSTQVMRQAIFADGAGEKERVRAQHLSGDAFERLGVGPFAGRLIAAQDDVTPGAHPVAVISHAFWTRRFGGDPGVIGRWFTLEERQFQIVGVTDPRFTGIEPGRPTDVWVPYSMYNPRAFGNFQFNWFRIVGRLQEHARVEQAEGVLHAAWVNLRRDRAGRLGPNQSPDSVQRYLQTPLYARSAANGPSPVRRQFERSLWILASIAGLVLLIAGANVANLFLARSASREHEMAIRVSIGANRGRLIQQLLIESAVVAGVACVIGLVLAMAAAPTVVAMLAPADDPVKLDLGFDWRLIAFAGGLTVLTTALFGIAPALRASAVAPVTALKSGGGRTGMRAGVMRPFVAVQVAFGLVVVFVGGLLVLSFVRLSSVNPGFASANVLLISLDTLRRVDANDHNAALMQILERLKTVPGVEQVSAAEYGLLGRAWTHGMRLPGSQHDTIESTMAPVTHGFIETMQIPVLAGRPFVKTDLDAKQPSPVIVNQAFASRYFGRTPAVGGTFEARFGDNDDGGIQEVVGVVADTRYDLRKPAAPTMYIPLRSGRSSSIYVRVAGDAAALGSRLREEVRAAGSVFRATTVLPQSVLVEQTLVRERLLALLSGFFAVVGLVLAAVGLYAVLSYSVAQRTREIGIRVALGARQLGVVRTVLGDASGAALAGAVCGLAGGLYLSRFVETLLFEVKPLEFWSLALPLGALLLTAAVAVAFPALRAARVDPVIALRYE